MGKIWCDLRALLVQNSQPRRSHQILFGEIRQNGWAKSGVLCAPYLYRRDNLADHTRLCPVNLGRMDGQHLL